MSEIISRKMTGRYRNVNQNHEFLTEQTEWQFDCLLRDGLRCKVWIHGHVDLKSGLFQEGYPE